MKFKIFEKKDDVEEKVYFRLSDEDGDIKLIACDCEGTWVWDILSIRTDGTLRRFGSVGKKIGLKLESGGMIKLVD